jgi:xanthine dehydrogenase accessory factor
MSEREQPWSDTGSRVGRILVLSDNPIARAVEAIGTAVGREVVVQGSDDGGPGLEARARDPVPPPHLEPPDERGHGVPGDAVELCDHDAPDAPGVLRAALASDAAYVAMMASRRRAAGLVAELRGEGVDVSRLHVPAGHDLGGKGPGEIALSVLAEIVAESYDRPGGPMRG